MIVAPSSSPIVPEPIPFSRLVRVEWIKATDTRSARWLLGLVGLTTTALMLVPVLVPTSFEQTQATYLRVAALGLTVLLPVVTILLFTGEWSQRSIMTTFTQEPRRIRVVNAKLAVSMLMGTGGAIFGGAVAAAGLAVVAAAGRDVASDMSVGVVAGYLIFVFLNVLAAVALGALLQNSAAVIIGGDYNSTPDMRQFRDLLTNGYRDAVQQTGSGFAPTFKADSSWGPPLITIDHILTRNAVASSVRTVKVPGSDHRAVLATIKVPTGS